MRCLHMGFGVSTLEVPPHSQITTHLTQAICLLQHSDLRRNGNCNCVSYQVGHGLNFYIRGNISRNSLPKRFYVTCQGPIISAATAPQIPCFSQYSAAPAVYFCSNRIQNPFALTSHECDRCYEDSSYRRLCLNLNVLCTISTPNTNHLSFSNKSASHQIYPVLKRCGGCLYRFAVLQDLPKGLFACLHNQLG